MVKVKRRSFPGCQSPAIIPFLAAAAIAAAGISCSSGVSTEEFEAVQKGLQTERAHSESLKSQLAQERARIASLEEAIYRADVTRAELETEVAKESANVAGLQKRGDEAEVRGLS